MERRVEGGLLWLRALLVGGLTVFLGVTGHVTADGLLPGPGVLVALGAAAVVLSAPALARRASTLRCVAMLTSGQAGVHLVLTVTGGHVGDAVARTGQPASAGLGSAYLPVLDGRRVGSLQDAYAGGAHDSLSPALPVGHLLSDLQSHAPMMLVHLVAAALVGLWLAVGERAAWTFVALTARRVVVAAHLLVHVVLPPHRPAPAPRAWLETRTHRDLWRTRPQPRRGPPLLLG